MGIAYDKPDEEPTLVLIPVVGVRFLLAEVLVSRLVRRLPVPNLVVDFKHIFPLGALNLVRLNVEDVLLFLQYFIKNR